MNKQALTAAITTVPARPGQQPVSGRPGVVARIEDDGRVTHWRIVRTTRDPLGAVIEYEPALPTTRQDTHR